MLIDIALNVQHFTPLKFLVDVPVEAQLFREEGHKHQLLNAPFRGASEEKLV